MRDTYQFPFPSGARTVPYISPPAPLVPFVCPTCSGDGIPSLEVRVNGVLIPTGGGYDFATRGESVGIMTTITLRNVGSAVLLVIGFSIPFTSATAPTGGWFVFDPPGEFSLGPGASKTIQVFTTPGQGFNQLGLADGNITIESNDPIVPHYLSHLRPQNRWYPIFYHTLPDFDFQSQTNFSFRYGTVVTNFGYLTGASGHALILGQLPPCSGPWNIDFRFVPGSTGVARVTVGDISLVNKVIGDGGISMTAQPFHLLPDGGVVMTVTLGRPTVLTSDRFTLRAPSDLLESGAPWDLLFNADWRIASAVSWLVKSPYTNGQTKQITVLDTDEVTLLAQYISTNGPVHLDAWTLTPTHTEPGSVGSWAIDPAAMFADNNDNPTLYTYGLRIMAPFLLNNVVPQTADLTVTIRKNGCTTETRLVHLEFFDRSAAAAPSIFSRTVIDFLNGTTTQLTAGPSPGIDIEWWSGDQDPVYSYQLSVTPGGTGPFTYQWKGTNGDHITGPWTTLTNSGAAPFVSGATAATLHIGSLTPGIVVPDVAEAAVRWRFYKCDVTNAGGTNSAYGYNLVPGIDG